MSDADWYRNIEYLNNKIEKEKARADVAEAEHRFSLGLVDNAQATIASLTEQLAEAREGLVNAKQEFDTIDCTPILTETSCAFDQAEKMKWFARRGSTAVSVTLSRIRRKDE